MPILWLRPHYAQPRSQGLLGETLGTRLNTPEKFENPTISGHFGFVFKVNSDGKSPDYCDAVIFVKRRFQNVFRRKASVSNSSSLKSVFEKLRFRDGLVWTAGLTVEIKLRFRDGLVWTGPK